MSILNIADAKFAWVNNQALLINNKDRKGWETFNAAEWTLDVFEKFEFQLKPASIRVGGQQVEIPQPVRSLADLEKDQIVYVPNLTDLDMPIGFYNTPGNEYRLNQYLKQNLLHTVEAMAVAHAHALVELTGGNIDPTSPVDPTPPKNIDESNPVEESKTKSSSDGLSELEVKTPSAVIEFRPKAKRGRKSKEELKKISEEKANTEPSLSEQNNVAEGETLKATGARQYPTATEILETIEAAATFQDLEKVENSLEATLNEFPQLARPYSFLKVEIAARKEKLSQLDLLNKKEASLKNDAFNTPAKAEPNINIDTSTIVEEYTAELDRCTTNDQLMEVRHKLSADNRLGRKQIQSLNAHGEQCFMKITENTSDVYPDNEPAQKVDASVLNQYSTKTETNRAIAEGITSYTAFGHQYGFDGDKAAIIERINTAKNLAELDSIQAELNSDQHYYVQSEFIEKRNTLIEEANAEWKAKLDPLLEGVKKAQTPAEANAYARYTRSWSEEQRQPLIRAITRRLQEIQNEGKPNPPSFQQRIEQAKDLTDLDTLEIDVETLDTFIQPKMMELIEAKRIELLKASTAGVNS